MKYIKIQYNRCIINKKDEFYEKEDNYYDINY